MKTTKRIIATATICFAALFLANAQEPRRPDKPGNPDKPNRQKQYTIEQAISDRAQMHTMAFSGLAFITGSFGADCFFPPGKVADFFGFQYMRDNDKNEMGHNTDFLTRIASNIIAILTKDQLNEMVVLGNQQTDLYDNFARKRWVLIKAFRESLDGKSQLNRDEVIKFGSSLYEIDADLSYNRAIMYGKIASSLSNEQKAKIAKLDFGNSATWPVIPENLDKQSMNHRTHVAVMTYASEFFSWYAGSVTADVYFCPERHATYFGGFYLKDYPAMGNPGYFISTALTGDKGKDFIQTLTPEQAACINATNTKHKPMMDEIVNLRKTVSEEFRKTLTGQAPDKAKVYSLIKRYGELDGEISYDDAVCFAGIFKTLSIDQKAKLVKLRDLDKYPKGLYLYSDPVDDPGNIDVKFLLK